MELESANGNGVIFDMDGVLVDSGEAHYQSWRRLGEEVGTEFTRELFDQTFGMHNRQIMPLWLGPISDAENDRLSLRKEIIYREVARDAVRGLDGAVELIGNLSAGGFRLAVGSSGPRANVELILDILGVTDRFAALATGDEVSHGKPDPEIFLNAVAKLGLPAARCVVIEDAPQGVAAGLAAGTPVVAVTSTRPAADLTGAHLIVDSLCELSAPRLREIVNGN